jgi:hypothetical protein
MSRVLLCILVLVCTDAFAQADRDWLYDKQRDTSSDLEYAARRTPRSQNTKEDKTVSIDTKLLVERLIQQPKLEATELACFAEVSISYAQMDDKIEVDAQIDNQECSSSYGKYTIRVRTSDETGETTTVNHEQAWQLENASQKQIVHVYDMNGDSELLSARIQGKAGDFCRCAAEKQDPENSDGEG